MKVLFKNSEGKEREIASFPHEGLSEEDRHRIAAGHISSFLEEKHYKSYYSRLWNQDNRTIVDVGSYTEFFIIDPAIAI